MSNKRVLQREGLQVPRILMVLSSFSPLFIFWMIKGSVLIPNLALCIVCGLLILIPTGFLICWIHRAKVKRRTQVLIAGESKDHTIHVLVYLFANLSPFIQEDPKSCRELLAIVFALGFIAFIFYRLNLHYLNIYFAIRGYRIHSVYLPQDDNQLSENMPIALISKRRFIARGERFLSHHLSDTVYMEIVE